MEFWIHGMRAKHMSTVRDYIYNGDAHDRSKVQVFLPDIKKFYYVFADPNDTSTFLEGLPVSVRNLAIHHLNYTFED